MPFRLANLIGFQTVWFASVYGAGAGLPWLGPLAAGLFASLHLQFSPTRRRDLHLLVAAIVLGFAVDSVFAASNLLDYASPWPSDSVAPLWILAMWAGFALTLNHSMHFLRDRLLWAALFGLVGGPLAYWGAGRAFDAVSYPGDALLAKLLLALAWAAVLPALYVFDDRLQRREEPA
jgi:hypothetical protein